MRARSSAAETVAVPRLPTTTAAAALAARIADFEVGAHRQHDREHGGDRVARARDVAHLAPNRPAHGPAPRRAHAASCRLRSASPARPCCRPRRASASAAAASSLPVSDRPARRVGQLLAVRRDDGGAAIDREIAALGIDDHRLARASSRARSPRGSRAASARPWRSRTAPPRRRAAAPRAPA